MMDAAKAVVNSFVICRVDYCNSLLAGAPRYQLDRLQSVLNTAARLLVGVPPVKLTTVANWAFPVVGPRTWNDLPDDVTSAESFHLPSAT